MGARQETERWGLRQGGEGARRLRGATHSHPAQVNEALARHKQRVPIATIASDLRVSRQTVFNYWPGLSIALKVASGSAQRLARTGTTSVAPTVPLGDRPMDIGSSAMAHEADVRACPQCNGRALNDERVTPNFCRWSGLD